jgi:membrane protease YdiL (CAAX protease family)
VADIAPSCDVPVVAREEGVGRARPAAAPKKRKPGNVIEYLKERHDPLTGLLLTIPVFLVYHLGILLIDLRNGVDWISILTFELLNRSLLAYIGVTIGIAAAIALAVYVLRRRGTLRPAELLPVLGESVLLAVFMALSVGWATHQLFEWQTGPRPMNPVEKLVMSAGAGFHEELVFRVILFGGSAFLLEKLARLSRAKAGWIAAIGSSLLFSAIHFVGPLGKELSAQTFTFLALGGLYLAAVYRFRGFAVAVYTHTIYDLLVFFLFMR